MTEVGVNRPDSLEIVYYLLRLVLLVEVEVLDLRVLLLLLIDSLVLSLSGVQVALREVV
jgi:hypothetical protein